MAKRVTVSAPELGDWLGMSEQNVRDLARRNIVQRAGRGRYDLKGSVQRYALAMRKIVTGRGGEAGEQRMRLAKAQASLAEAKARKATGELVEAADVIAEWSGILRGVRAGMLAVPSRVQQRLPHLTAHDVVEIDREVRLTLTEMGKDCD